MKEKKIITTAKVVSIVFTPFYLPLLGMIALLVFSYLNMLPTYYKLSLLTIIYFFTVLLPTYLIHLYHRYQGWSPLQLGQRERRIIPYVISILCYFTCFYLMNLFNMPHFMGSILVAALAVQTFCAIINLCFKVSTHTSAIGGLTGCMLAFSFIFNFNPIWWLCLLVFLGGMVGSSRMILRQHNLSEVVSGYVIGAFAAFTTILFV